MLGSCGNSIFNLKKKNPYFYILVALGLHCGAQAFSSCGEQGLFSSCGARAFSSCRVGTLLQLRCAGFLLWWLPSLWRIISVAPQHVDSSWTRDQTHVSCIGRQSLSHWTTGEVPGFLFDSIDLTLESCTGPEVKESKVCSGSWYGWSLRRVRIHVKKVGAWSCWWAWEVRLQSVYSVY